MAYAAVPEVEDLCVPALEKPHPLAEVGVGRLNQEVDMVVHEAVAQAAPSKPAGGGLQPAEVEPAISIVAVDGLTVISASEHVVDPAGLVLARLPGHSSFKPGGERFATLRTV
jgi:hypothetical protein